MTPVAHRYKSNEEYVYVRGRGRGKYVCEECGIRCKKPSMLKKHIRTHTDVRPYVCKYCNFAFKTKGKRQSAPSSSAQCIDFMGCLQRGREGLPRPGKPHEAEGGGWGSLKWAGITQQDQPWVWCASRVCSILLVFLKGENWKHGFAARDLWTKPPQNEDELPGPWASTWRQALGGFVRSCSQDRYWRCTFSSLAVACNFSIFYIIWTDLFSKDLHPRSSSH